MNYLYWQEISFFLNSVDKEKSDFEKSSMNLEAMDDTKSKMIHLIEVLRNSLEQRLDKHHASLVIFPIVAWIDEKMQGYDYTANKVKWAPLQKDFYSAYNAGEIFFKSLDDILDDPNIPNIVFQVYYAMLKRGFVGKYKDSKTQINKYLEILKDKIPSPVILNNQAADSSLRQAKKTGLKRWHCYAFSVAFAGIVYGVLTIVGHL